MAGPRPFDFVDFDARAESANPAPRQFTAEDLAAARLEGVGEGRRLALESIAADDASALANIMLAIARSEKRLDDEIAAARAEFSTLSRAFIEEYCAAIADERSFEAAEDLLRRLTDNSEDRRSATLFLSERHFERLATRLSAALSDRRMGDFVSIDVDPSLKPGECRVEWRGGEIRRTRAEISAAVASLFDHSDEDAMEP